MKRPNILLVDDNRLFLEMEKEFLQSCAVQIYTACDGKEALDVMRMVLPDLVFMDLHMPEMDGDECCAVIKADPDLKSVPVVMVVANAERRDMERCHRAGCDLIVTKPVDREVFLQAGHRFMPGLDRIEMRVPCLTLVVFTIGDRPSYGTSANLSTHGMFIAYDGEVEIGDLARMSFLIPGSCGNVIEVVGRIAWLNGGLAPLCKPSLPRGFGVQFCDISPDAAAAILEFMKRDVGDGSSPIVEEAYIAEKFF